MFLVTIEEAIAVTIPVKILKKLKFTNEPTILKGVVLVNSELGPAYSITVLNKIMHTASLVIPSPKTNEKSFGYYSYLIIEMAATTSVQQRREHIKRISMTERVNCSYSLYKFKPQHNIIE